MELILIGIVIPFIILIILRMHSLYNSTKNIFGELVALICSFIIILLIISISWFAAFSDPYDYVKYSNIVDESKELLMQYENTSGIGHGLEALELKQDIVKYIAIKNNYYTGMQVYLSSPFTIWKHVMRDRCDYLGIEV